MVIGDAITPDSTINDDMVMGMNKGDNGTHAETKRARPIYYYFHMRAATPASACLIRPPTPSLAPIHNGN